MRRRRGEPDLIAPDHATVWSHHGRSSPLEARLHGAHAHLRFVRRHHVVRNPTPWNSGSGDEPLILVYADHVGLAPRMYHVGLHVDRPSGHHVTCHHVRTSHLRLARHHLMTVHGGVSWRVLVDVLGAHLHLTHPCTHPVAHVLMWNHSSHPHGGAYHAPMVRHVRWHHGMLIGHSYPQRACHATVGGWSQSLLHVCHHVRLRPAHVTHARVRRTHHSGRGELLRIGHRIIRHLLLIGRNRRRHGHHLKR